MISGRQTIHLTGHDKPHYTAYEYDIREGLPDYSGIYIVTRFDGNHHINYVGQSNNISNRLSNHENWDCFNKHHSSHILTIEILMQEEKDFVEADIIKHYQPKCNEQLK